MLTIEGNIVNTNKVFRGRVEIDGSGIINKIGDPRGDADFVFGEELIFPGFIDLHVHARECADHSQDYKEDFKTAGEAAIAGGVVAYADMPNNPTPPVDDASYEAKNNLAKKSIAEVLLYAGIGSNTSPLKRRVPYKVFMGPSIGGLFFKSNRELEEKIKLYKGQNVSFHCEDPEILETKTHELTHELRRPKEAEIVALSFALELIKKYKLKGKICHASTIEGIRKIAEAKRWGVNVTVEVTPHHLFFSNKNEKMFQVNPPIRQSEENRLALIQALKNGDIDYLATDHAPHTLEEKEKGVSGIPHLDTYGSFMTWLMAEHDFTPEDIARICAKNPGDFFSEFAKEKHGEIREGYVGSLTVIDPNKKIKIERKNLKTKCGWSPFEGFTFPGSVIMTIVRGKVYDQR